jgi:hypothetical protein
VRIFAAAHCFVKRLSLATSTLPRAVRNYGHTAQIDFGGD